MVEEVGRKNPRIETKMENVSFLELEKLCIRMAIAKAAELENALAMIGGLTSDGGVIDFLHFRTPHRHSPGFRVRPGSVHLRPRPADLILPLIARTPTRYFSYGQLLHSRWHRLLGVACAWLEMVRVYRPDRFFHRR